MTVPQAGCSFTFVGTATALLRFGPFAVLTEPNFLHRGELAYLGKGLISRRLTEPALRVEEVPELDAPVTPCWSTTCARSPSGTRASTSPSCISAERRCQAGWS